MNKFSQRSYEKELMDYPIEDKSVLFSNLRELEFINIMTGGPRLTFSSIKKMLPKDHHGTVTIVDVGYGAGDFLEYILKNWNYPNIILRLIGVDYSPEVKEYIDKYHPELNSKVDFYTCSYQDFFTKDIDVDIVTAGLFCHHLDDLELDEFLKMSSSKARIGVVINDLHRHPLAYYSIKGLTQLFSKSAFTQNDAPLSVLRSFKISDWKKYLNCASISNYIIQWKWAFRHLITIKK